MIYEAVYRTAPSTPGLLKNVTHDMWHIVGDEHSLKMSVTKFLQFGMNSVLQILNSMNE